MRGQKLLLLLILFLAFNNLYAVETVDRYVKLVIDEKTGSFSLFYLTNPDPKVMQYEPLFNSRNPTASFMDISYDGSFYRLGRSRAFSTKLERVNSNPKLTFESSFLQVTKTFSPVRTPSSPVANGIKIDITVKNTGINDAAVGLRFLLDTHLGEGRRGIPFRLEDSGIKGETIVEGKSVDSYWISRGRNASLMGSIVNPFEDNTKNPDYLFFANWKKLSDVPWKPFFYEDKSFNFGRYSIGDSAVCYYYDPQMLARGASFKYTIYLTTEDPSFYDTYASYTAPVPVPFARQDMSAETETEIETGSGIIPYPDIFVMEPTISMEAIERKAVYNAALTDDNFNLAMLKELQAILNQFMAGEIMLNDMDLAEIEKALEKYGFKE